MILISLLLATLYVGVAIGKARELPESISAMVYVLPKGGWRWLWTVWLWLVGIFTLAPMIETLDAQGAGVMGFVTLCWLGLVGCWPLFDEQHLKWHYRVAIAAGVLSQVCVLLASPWWLLLWLLWPSLACIMLLWPESKTAKVADTKGVFAAEVICYVTTVLAALI